MNFDVIRATTAADIERHKIEDDYPSPEMLGPIRVNVRWTGCGRPSCEARLVPRSVLAPFGLPLRTLQQWEQKRRAPDGPARPLLDIMEHEPEAVMRVVGRSAANGKL